MFFRVQLTSQVLFYKLLASNFNNWPTEVASILNSICTRYSRSLDCSPSSFLSYLFFYERTFNFLKLLGFSSKFSSLAIQIFLVRLHDTSGHPLRSLDRHDLVPMSMTATAHLCAYASTGPLLWNDLPALTCAQIKINITRLRSPAIPCDSGLITESSLC